MVGAQQIDSAIIATVRYQIIYRIEFHAFIFQGTLSIYMMNHIVSMYQDKYRVNETSTNKMDHQLWKAPWTSTTHLVLSKGGGTSEIKFNHS